ncbi:MAG: BON domain-containing protein [Chloroflexi bacterium]|nr:BON domain-containing protein [Chloroflexota bacterium]
MFGITLNIGAAVHCKDGRAGRLVKIVVDPHTKRITDLIVEKGHLQKKDRVLPLSAVDLTTKDDIYLKIDCAELANYPEYREVEFRMPAPGAYNPYSSNEVLHWVTAYGPVILDDYHVPQIRQTAREGIDTDDKILERGMPIYSLDGMIAKIDHLLVNPETGDILYIIARKGIFPYQVIIPMTAVDEIGEKGVYIRKTNEEIQEFARYTPRLPADILQDLRQRLDKAVPNFQHVQLDLQNGIMRLFGHVKNEAQRQEAEKIARGVSGVVDVDNTLTTSVAIQTEILAAIQADERTKGQEIDVAFQQGIATLTGVVTSPEARQAAEELAAQHPHVIAVVNDLEMQPETIGEKIVAVPMREQ